MSQDEQRGVEQQVAREPHALEVGGSSPPPAIAGREHVRFHLGTVAELREHGEHLLRAHAEEAEPDLAPQFAPDWDTYLDLEICGNLIVVVARSYREQISEIIGYAVAFVSRSPHYARLFCQHDLLYVAPTWRGGRVGLRLINELRREAKERGATRLIMHAKLGSRLESMLPRLGFKSEETVFTEELK